MSTGSGFGSSPSSFVVDPALLGLVDAVALVTGGAQSIGRGCAVQLARAGCHVMIADIADATKAVAEIEGLGRQAASVTADMRSKAAVEAMVDETVRRFGRLDVAVNTVGSTRGPKPFLDLGRDEWDDVVTQNLTTTLVCMQVEALAMIDTATAGRIINVGSLSGVVGSPNAAGYGAANAAVAHLTSTAALELATYGIRVNCIVPGTHLTETTRRAADEGTPALVEWIRLAASAAPLGRLGDPMETGGLAVFLASSLSSYVTGQAIISDGGLVHTTSRPPIGMAMKPAAVTAQAERRAGELRGLGEPD